MKKNKVLFFRISVILLFPLLVYSQDRRESILKVNEGKKFMKTVPYKAERMFEEATELDTSYAEAWYYLGKVRLREIGNIDGAFESLIKALEKIESGGAGINISKDEIKDEIDYIKSKFKTLKIKLKNKKIDRLGFIKGVNLSFKYPERYLDDTQKLRLNYLEKERKVGEFQFTNIDPEDKNIYFEFKYFPIRQYSIRRTEYIVDVVGQKRARRYRFDITTRDTSISDLYFYWMENEWELIERVPLDLVKVEFPKEYKFVSNIPNSFSTLQKDNYGNLYIPTGDDIEITLSESIEKNEERLYKYMNMSFISLIVIGTFLTAR